MDSSTKPNVLKVAFLNIQGQLKFTQARKDQIEHVIKSNQLDVLHLQETNICDGEFDLCHHISNNFQIIAQNNESGFGVCSLIHKRFVIENLFLHPSGRILCFDIEDLTLVNVYLPSGSEAKQDRENLIGQDIPNLLLHRRKGLVGGDWNAITAPIDCTNLPDPKMSPNLKKLIKISGWSDTFRTLHPKKVAFSHFYSRNMGDSGLSQGASRLDRSYSWGEVSTISSTYLGAGFSDHLIHKVELAVSSSLFPVEPVYKPFFKINPLTAKDPAFKEKVRLLTADWEVTKGRLPLLQWWELLKRDIRHAAKEISAETKKNNKARLDILMLAQTYLSRQVSEGNLAVLVELMSVQKEIAEWFNREAEKVKLHAKLDDIEQSETVRIYHHDKLYRSKNKKSILKLKSGNEVVEGHAKCAKVLNDEVKQLLGEEILLDTQAQEELLAEVEPSFTDEDNNMLEAVISDKEILESLKRSNKSASPGSDALTYLVYEECWESIGKHLCEVLRHVVQEGVPAKSMQFSYLVFSSKPGKAGSILPKDLRKLSLLQTDHKVLTGVLAARLRKTEDHTLSAHQYAAGPRKIQHAITQARDLINNISPNQRGCAVIQTDFIQAYDLLSVNWTWQVLKKKKCSLKFISILENLYEKNPSFIVNIINNQRQPVIRNKRKSIYQGDKTSTVLYNFSIDCLLNYLQRRLKGLVYYKMETAGPLHPLFGKPAPASAKLKMLGYVDDLKAIVSSKEEFFTVDKALVLFEKASGSKLHRDLSTKKCEILPLGRWSRWTQADSPLPFMSIVDKLNFLGVILARSPTKTRSANGDVLVSKVKNTIGSFQAGRHSPLVCRPHALNCFIMSKITYKASVINLRSQDLHAIAAAAKRWACQHLLIKPPEVLLYRKVEEGGLGLMHTEARCQAYLTKNFVEQGHIQSKNPSLYLQALYRKFVLHECIPGSLKRPPVYSLDFFLTIEEALQEEPGCLLSLSTRQWYTRIMERSVTAHKDPITGHPEFLNTSQELLYPDADWLNVWSMKLTRGLSPAQKSWLFEYQNNLHVNNERLHKLGKKNSPICDFCEESDNRAHLLFCTFNKIITSTFRNILEEVCSEMLSPTQLALVDLDPPRLSRLPFLFFFCETAVLLQKSREMKKEIPAHKLVSSILVKAKVFLQADRHQPTYDAVSSWLARFHSVTPGPQGTGIHATNKTRLSAEGAEGAAEPATAAALSPQHLNRQQVQPSPS